MVGRFREVLLYLSQSYLGASLRDHTRRGSRIGRAQASRMEDHEFEYQPSKTNDLQN